jgi:hypothetical protein
MNDPYLASVTHDISSNTLEALWIQDDGISLNRVKCRNYSADQKDEFLQDCGDLGQKYVLMAGW